MPYLVQDYFSESAARNPDKIAVTCRDDEISYAELDARSNALARHLQNRGLARGSFVPFFIEKSINSIQAILSILKADCAYVPLDTRSPPERLLAILENTGAKHLLVDARTGDKLPDAVTESGIEIVNIDAVPEVSAKPLDYQNISIDIAYVLFTSGSTGTPKGVMISHDMILDYIDWCVETYKLDNNDNIANHAPLYFDNSTFDLYTSFKAGGTLHLVHDQLNIIMSKLVPWLQKRQISCFFCVPSVLTILLKSGKLQADSFPAMRHIIAAGEVLPPLIVQEWMKLYPEVQFTNMYGPTEITVDCTFHVINETPNDGSIPIPIGRSRRNMEVFVRKDDGSLSKEPGDVGEISVRGRSVSYGYLGNEERSRQAFIQNPEHNRFHDQIYLTGDLGRILDDGAIEFMGRRDHQIKYMGNRIELGEIEAAMLSLDGVSEAIAVFNDSPIVEEKCIGALLCGSSKLSRDKLAAELKDLLPPYMMPRRILIADDLPRTPNGKADRKAALEKVFAEG